MRQASGTHNTILEDDSAHTHTVPAEALDAAELGIVFEPAGSRTSATCELNPPDEAAAKGVADIEGVVQEVEMFIDSKLQHEVELGDESATSIARPRGDVVLADQSAAKGAIKATERVLEHQPANTRGKSATQAQKDQSPRISWF